MAMIGSRTGPYETALLEVLLIQNFGTHGGSCRRSDDFEGWRTNRVVGADFVEDRPQEGSVGENLLLDLRDTEAVSAVVIVRGERVWMGVAVFIHVLRPRSLFSTLVGIGVVYWDEQMNM